MTALADIVTRAVETARLENERRTVDAGSAAELLRSLPELMEVERAKRGLTMKEAALSSGITEDTWQAAVYRRRQMQVGKAIVILDWISRG